MDDDLLSSATEALRETSGEADGSATRLRLRRSLEANHRGHRQFVSFATMSAILLGGTMSWAFATGRAAAVWRGIVDPEPVEAVRAEPEPPAPTPQRTVQVPQRRVEQPPVPVPQPEPEPEPTPAPPPPVRIQAPVRAVAPARVQARAIEELYREAHKLHFDGTDYPAAIAAWDAYLAVQPKGRFVAEARYNRGLALIRVGRYAEARTALEPYARGEILRGYRQREAAQLVERLPKPELND